MTEPEWTHIPNWRQQELCELAADVLCEIDFFHPIVWKDQLQAEEVTLAELYWMRAYADVDIGVSIDFEEE